MNTFRAQNSRAIREPEIFSCATALRSQGFSKIGAIGYCYGGWGVLRLGSRIDGQPPLVDAVIAGHPSWLVEKDFDDVAVPMQMLAPETDGQLTDELKRYCFEAMVLRKKDVPFEYVHLAGVAHGCLTKGDERVKGEREAMVKGKDAAVDWFRQWLF